MTVCCVWLVPRSDRAAEPNGAGDVERARRTAERFEAKRIVERGDRAHAELRRLRNGIAHEAFETGEERGLLLVSEPTNAGAWYARRVAARRVELAARIAKVLVLRTDDERVRPLKMNEPCKPAMTWKSPTTRFAR